MHCRRCAIDYPEDKRLCNACGDPLTPSNDTITPFPRCSKCGSAFSTTDRFCPGCGTSHGNALPFPVRTPVVAASSRSNDDPDPSAIRVEIGEERRELRNSIALVAAAGLFATVFLGLGVNAYRARGGRAPMPAATAAKAHPSIGNKVSQVATADEIGIKIAGAGAADLQRAEPVIRRDVERHLAELQQGYLAVVRTDPAVEGVLTLHVTLAADGTVAYVRSTPLGLTNRELVSTVERQAAGWRFEPSSMGSTSVHYPLVFHLPETDPDALIARLLGSRGPVVGATRRALQATQLHAGASWSSEVLRDLEKGDSVAVVARRGDWLEVKGDDTQPVRGYVWAEHVAAD
jgi:hypothetical protein